MPGIFNVKRQPVASTYWRYLDSLQINQAQAMLSIMQAIARAGLEAMSNKL